MYINSFMLYLFFVASTTGTVGNIGTNIADGDGGAFIVRLFLVLTFMFGASISGYLIPSSQFSASGNYLSALIIEVVLIMIALILEKYREKSEWFLYFVSAACGLQNALTTTYSGAIIRTTHVTGAVTDIGIQIGRIFVGNVSERWKLLLLIPICVAYAFGSFVAGEVYPKWERQSLLLSVIFFSTFAFSYFLWRWKNSSSFWDALTSENIKTQ